MLNLSETQVTAAGISRLRGLKRLAELQLNRTRVTEACVDDLLRLPRRERREVRDTGLSDEAVGRLQVGLPGLRVVR
ncbi:hypothetical protein [Tautonia sociabilis]|uniref:Leucine-rich repeat domain-containing protein n=1 Tax=Tautonia sociabilis TaxID=2080755 RepID=A0A432MN96_9BACT|nr:hypothetical protein [Tautonia sociabilis]RUL88719.1 hypothetical protein TsocGM_06175 [Tautonia sociabilis]